MRALGVILIVFILIYFHAGIFRGFSYVANAIFKPVISVGGEVKGGFSNIILVFQSKKSLQADNENLKAQLDESLAQIANYNSIVDENNKLKEILGRIGDKKQMIVAGILAKPNQSLYGTLLIDAGTNQGVILNAKVFALGNVPIGRIAEVFPNSAKVVLFSSPGEKTDVVVSGKDIFLQAIGRGGGNFELVLPRDMVIENGTEVNLPGLTPYILGTVVTIISDPRDSFQKALLVSPVNIQELKFVEIEK